MAGQQQQQEAKPQPGTLDDGLGIVKDGWFTELSTMWPGQGLSLQVDEVMFRGRSKFQVCKSAEERMARFSSLTRRHATQFRTAALL
jgi:Spermidine synthase tetramerisation domain